MLAEAPDNNQEANQPTETLTFQKFATVDECKESTGNIDGCSIYFEAVNSDKEIELVDTGDAHTLPNHDALDI